jgi:hypothetical protein
MCKIKNLNLSWLITLIDRGWLARPLAVGAETELFGSKDCPVESLLCIMRLLIRCSFLGLLWFGPALSSGLEVYFPLFKQGIFCLFCFKINININLNFIKYEKIEFTSHFKWMIITNVYGIGSTWCCQKAYERHSSPMEANVSIKNPLLTRCPNNKW